MANEYLETLLGNFPAALSDAAAAALGEPRKPTADALSLCRSALLGSLTSAVRVPGVAQALLPHIIEAAGEIPRLADLSQLYQGRLQPTSLGELAKIFLGILFGKSLTDLTGQIAQSAALKPASAPALLEMTAAHLLPALGLSLKTANATTPAGLLQILEGASARWPRAAPAWLIGAAPLTNSTVAASAVAAGAGLAASMAADAATAASGLVSAKDIGAAGSTIAAAITSHGHQTAGHAAGPAGASHTVSTAEAVHTQTVAATVTTNLADEILASAANARISEAITPLQERPAVGITAIETAASPVHAVKAPPAARAKVENAMAARPPAHHHAPPAPLAAPDRHHDRGGGWVWALPALLLLGTAGWWLWGQTPAPVHKEAAAVPNVRVETPEPPAPPRPAAVEQTETVVGPPGRTEYYGESSTFAADVWTNPDYSTLEASLEPAPAEAAIEAAVAEPVPGRTELYEAGTPFTADVWTNPGYTADAVPAEPTPVAEAVAEELPPPVPGRTELYEAGTPFTADVWTNPGYTADALPTEPAPVAEAVAEELPPPTPGHTEYYANSEPFTADVWTNADYTADPAPAPEAVTETLEPVPGHTELYEAAAPFTAEVWTNPGYTTTEPAPVEVLAEPVPGRTEYYEATRSFEAETWANPDYDPSPVQVAAAEPMPEPVPGRTEYYSATQPFSGEVWSNPAYKTANAAPPSKETVVKCQSTLNGALSPIRFKTARADLTPEGRSALDKMAEAIKQCPGVSVRIEGHTDSDGDTDFNQELSEARAKSVTAYLASVGVDAARLKPKGFGETKPIASNDDDAGKARNRRIDFVVDEH